MQVYLPIAELAEPIWLLVAMGGAAGVLSGMFGIGGGIVLTPLLIFIGVPPAVAVATSACQIVAAASSGFLHHWKHHRVDTHIGNFLIAGGIVGATLGTLIFAALRRSGQADLSIALMYITLLSTVAFTMAREGLTMLRQRASTMPAAVAYWPLLQRLPLQRHFARSHVTHSVFVPVLIGMGGGLLVALMGVGGGFLMIPAMLYILRMPAGMVVGTSLYQIIFVTSLVTLLNAMTTQTVDIVLAALLMLGSAAGAQWGARLSARLPHAASRLLLAALLVVVCTKLAMSLFATPSELYTLMETGR